MSRHKHEGGHYTALERWYVLLVCLGMYDLYYAWQNQGAVSGRIIGATGIVLLVTGLYGYLSKRKFWKLPKLVLVAAVPALLIATVGVLSQVVTVFGVA